MKKTKLATFLIFALLMAAPLDAEIYKYIDENGQKRWTDDLSQVPEQQRAAAQRIETDAEKPDDAITGKVEKAQSESATGTKTGITDTGTAGENAELSREALEAEKAELDLRYQQLLEEREQIEKLTPEARDAKTRAELNKRINAFNNQTKQYEEQLDIFNQKVNTFNQAIMQKRTPQNE